MADPRLYDTSVNLPGELRRHLAQAMPEETDPYFEGVGTRDPEG